jgi:hypothetical protein
MPTTPSELRTGAVLRNDVTQRLVVVLEDHVESRLLLKVRTYVPAEAPRYMAVRGALQFHSTVIPAPSPLPDAPPDWLFEAA